MKQTNHEEAEMVNIQRMCIPRTFSAFFVLLPFLLHHPTCAQSQLEDSDVPWLRGSGAELEMRLAGTIFDKDGVEASKPIVQVCQLTDNRWAALSPTLDGSSFEIWVPVNRDGCEHLSISAATEDGSQVTVASIEPHEMRAAAIDGIDIHLGQQVRRVLVQVEDVSGPVENATVALLTSSHHRFLGSTGENGECEISMPIEMRSMAITAWTDDYRLGEVDYSGKPPYSSDAVVHKISIEQCHTKRILLRNSDRQVASGVRCVVSSLDIRYADYGYFETNEEGVFEFPYCLDANFLGYLVVVVDDEWDEMTFSNFDVLADQVEVQVYEQPTLQITGSVVLGDECVPGSRVVLASNGQRERHFFTGDTGRFDLVAPRGFPHDVLLDDDRLYSRPIRLKAGGDVEKIAFPALQAFPGHRVDITLTRVDSGQPITNHRIDALAMLPFIGHEKSLFGIGHMPWNRSVETNEEGVGTIYAAPGALSLNTKIGMELILEEIEVNESAPNRVRIETSLPESQ